jgi:hypothetical protein
MSKIIREREKLAADYIAAYKACNPRDRPPQIEYFRGWFILKRPWAYPKKYRPKVLMQMRDTLIERSALASAIRPEGQS